MENEKKDFEIPSTEDCLLNLVYWRDMSALRVKEILEKRYGAVPESVDDKESEICEDVG